MANRRARDVFSNGGCLSPLIRSVTRTERSMVVSMAGAKLGGHSRLKVTLGRTVRQKMRIIIFIGGGAGRTR